MPLEQLPKKPQGADWSSGIIAFLLAVCAITFYDYPKFSQWQQNKQDIKSAQTQLADLKQQQTALLQSINAIEQNQDTFRLVNLALPDQPQIQDVYADVELLAKSVNMKLDSIQSDDPTATEDQQAGVVQSPAVSASNSASAAADSLPPNVGYIRVKCEMSGTTLQLKQFLSALEQSLRFMDVQQIDIAEEQNNQMAFRLEFNTYYQKK